MSGSGFARLNDGKTVAAMDLLLPGIGEIIGGAQREERLDVLDGRMDPQLREELGWYRDLRRYGSVPHSGFGLGLERFLTWIAGMLQGDFGVSYTYRTPVAELIGDGDFAGALKQRGGRFERSLRTLRTIVRALPHSATPGQKRLNIALVHSGGPAPGMNTAVRASLRLALDQGHRVLGVRNGFRGFVDGDHEVVSSLDAHADADEAVGDADAHPQPARQRFLGHRGRHGYEYSAAQSQRSY